MNKNFKLFLKEMEMDEHSIYVLAELKTNDFINYFLYNKRSVDLLNIANHFHKNQVDKSGCNYMVHLIDVADKALVYWRAFGLCLNVLDIMVESALLHDTIEDSENDERYIFSLFDKYNIDTRSKYIIKSISRNKNESYFDFIYRIKRNSSKDKLCSIIKCCDLHSNMNVERMNATNCYINDSMKNRYMKATKILKDN